LKDNRLVGLVIKSTRLTG